jgi:hypothetical protein
VTNYGAVVGVDTIEEGDLPERVANYTSLAAFGAKTQGDWEDDIWGAEEDRWGANGLLGGLFTGLANAGSFVLSLLTTLLENVFAGVGFVVQSVSDAVTALANNFAAWWESVTRANTTGVIVTNNALAAQVSGGVAISDEFDGASANDLGAAWSAISDGAGAGFYGLSGTGRALWKSSGGAFRRHIYVYDTPLGTDYQLVSCVVGATPTSVLPLSPGFPLTYLIGRCNSAGTSFVWAGFSGTRVAIGYTDAGTYYELATAILNVYGGQEIDFFIGTDDDDRQFILKINGVTVLDYTDSDDDSPLGDVYVGVGAAASAGSLEQRRPPSLSAWAATDRLPAAGS